MAFMVVVGRQSCHSVAQIFVCVAGAKKPVVKVLDIVTIALVKTTKRCVKLPRCSPQFLQLACAINESNLCFSTPISFGEAVKKIGPTFLGSLLV
jgi:hypothetical protein